MKIALATRMPGPFERPLVPIISNLIMMAFVDVFAGMIFKYRHFF